MLWMRLSFLVRFAKITWAAFAMLALFTLRFARAALLLFAGIPIAMAATLLLAGPIIQLAQGAAQ
jgi:hypothetical protein